MKPAADWLIVIVDREYFLQFPKFLQNQFQQCQQWVALQLVLLSLIEGVTSLVVELELLEVSLKDIGRSGV